MITNKLNNYIGFLAFAIFWLIFILSKVLDWNILITVPLLAICMLIQITALWMPDAIYIPIKFLGMTSEKLFLDQVKEEDEFTTDYNVKYKVTLKKENIIVLNCSTSSISIPIGNFVPFLKDNEITKYNNKPIKFDPLW